MMLGIIPFMLLAFVLGVKHSYDSDHLIAVSNILRKVDSAKSSAKAGMSWAAGHMLAATIITIALFIFKESFLSDALPSFEKLAGIMLIALGVLSLIDFFRLHSHAHRHGNIAHSHPHIHFRNREGKKHSHRHMLGIGIVHGLAGNDELLILFTASLAVTSLGGLITALGLFSLGVAFGMALFAIAFSFPLIRLQSKKICSLTSFASGSAGIIYGALILFPIL